MTTIPRRICKVQVEVGQSKAGESITHDLREFDGLNVRFDILKRRGAQMNKAKISICNLTRANVEYLTTINNWNTPPAERKIIRLFGGYADRSGLLFEGDIIRAAPAMKPDIWLSAECLSGYHNNMRIGSFSFARKMKTSDIAAQIARELNLNLDYQATQDKVVAGFAFSGGLTNAIKELNDIGGIIAWQEDDFLRVADEKQPEPKSGQTARLYSKRSGLIGLPEPDQFGVKFKVLLDPTLKCGEAVQLESEQIPVANGVYYIYAIRHRRITAAARPKRHQNGYHPRRRQNDKELRNEPPRRRQLAQISGLYGRRRGSKSTPAKSKKGGFYET